MRLTVADPVAGLHYSLQDAKNVPVDVRIAGANPLSFDVPVTLSPDGKLGGTFVRREGAVRRFAYIAVGAQAGDTAHAIDRRAKIDVHDIPAALLVPGATLEVVLPGRGRDGTPSCATVRPLTPWRKV